MQLLLLSLLMIVAVAGCANPYAVMRDANRAALTRIEVGMTKSEVETMMGQRAAEGVLGRYENPYKKETIRGTDGTSYDVLYYYTQQIGERSIETGLTPIVLSNGRVMGIGWGFLDGISGVSTTTIRRR